MEVVICSDEQQVGQIAANRVLQWVEGLTTPVLGLATGSSPLTLYNELARRVAAADFLLAKVLQCHGRGHRCETGWRRDGSRGRLRCGLGDG